ncbi:hypothetical protein D7U34_04345 [Salmonella enterica]|nr:hypothetical protein [Salmonella enterica]
MRIAGFTATPEKLLFADGVLQPFYFSRGLGKSHFLQINTDCPPPSDNAAFIVDPDSMGKSSTSPPLPEDTKKAQIIKNTYFLETRKVLS